MAIYSSFHDERLYEMLTNGTASERENAFRELYARHGKRVHAYCVRIIGNATHAEDIFQETFVRFFNAAQNEREMTNIPAFLLRIARNLCLNYKRDTRTMVEFKDYVIDDNLAHNPHEYDNSELLNLITTALELLDPDHREAFVLRKYQDLSYQEIAEVTNTSETNARSRVHRAQQKIREILSPYLADIDQHL
jgi:RNA polymerase sigma-70 factor, ECF subfamily